MNFTKKKDYNTPNFTNFAIVDRTEAPVTG